MKQWKKTILVYYILYYYILVNYCFYILWMYIIRFIGWQKKGYHASINTRHVTYHYYVQFILKYINLNIYVYTYVHTAFHSLRCEYVCVHIRMMRKKSPRKIVFPNCFRISLLLEELSFKLSAFKYVTNRYFFFSSLQIFFSSWFFGNLLEDNEYDHE